MDDELAEAKAKLESEYNEVRESMGDLHVAYNAVLDAGAEDNVHDLLKTLEKAVQDVRDGGIIGSGSNDHRRALEKYQKLKNPNS